MCITEPYQRAITYSILLDPHTTTVRWALWDSDCPFKHEETEVRESAHSGEALHPSSMFFVAKYANYSGTWGEKGKEVSGRK